MTIRVKHKPGAHRKIVGYYNEYGYRIFSTDGYHDQELYAAGNCRYDSAQTLPLDAKNDICSLEKLATFCRDTAMDMAVDLDLDFTGVEYESIDEAE